MLKVRMDTPVFCEADCRYFEVVHDRVWGKGKNPEHVIRCRHSGACEQVAGVERKVAYETREEQ